MICVGPQNLSPSRLEAEAAQLRILEAFRPNFLSRHPDGLVTSELEYQGGTTSPYSVSRPLRTFGRPRLNAILDALAEDFRNWSKERDYRKCDVLGIANDGFTGELIEVTTEANAPSAIKQLNVKLAILRQTVNRIHNLSVDWRPASWRPDATLFCPLPSTAQEVRFVCYEPTTRAAAPAGIVLYEIHSLTRALATNPLPRDVQDAIRKQARAAGPRTATAPTWASELASKEPTVPVAIKALAAAGALVMVVAAIAALIDPVPGDELAAFAAATALLRVAQGR